VFKAAEIIGELMKRSLPIGNHDFIYNVVRPFPFKSLSQLLPEFNRGWLPLFYLQHLKSNLKEIYNLLLKYLPRHS